MLPVNVPGRHMHSGSGHPLVPAMELYLFRVNGQCPCVAKVNQETGTLTGQSSGGKIRMVSVILLCNCNNIS